VTKFAKRLCFDLADAFARDTEFSPDFLERAKPAIFDPEPEQDDLALTLGQLAQGLANLRLQQLLCGDLDWSRHRFVFDEIAQERITFVAHRRFERNRVSGDIEHLPNLLVGDIHRSRDFFLSWLAFEDLLKPMTGLLDSIDRFANVYGQANGSTLI
jgi:hypothetical protein